MQVLNVGWMDAAVLGLKLIPAHLKHNPNGF